MEVSSHVIEQSIQLALTYQVSFTQNVFDPKNPLLLEAIHPSRQDYPAKLLAVFDQELVRWQPHLLDDFVAYTHTHAQTMRLVQAPFVLPAGEPCKNDPTLVTQLHEAIHRHGICRHSYVIVVGGGALTDLVGYAAATAHRGVRLIRIPSTVLAQCDAALAVKNAINAFGKKNFLGTFTAPAAVLCDVLLLKTLDDRDWRSGLAECIKVALLKDEEFFTWLEANAQALALRDLTAMGVAVRRGAVHHLHHIATSGDPFELGSSRPLDFGHWSAHKLEQLSAYEIRHGEAVAMGLALDVTYSHELGLLPTSQWKRILRLFRDLGFVLYSPLMHEHIEDRDHPQCLFKGLDEFREHLGGPLTIMLLNAIGQCVEVNEIDESCMMRCLDFLRDQHRRGEEP